MILTIARKEITEMWRDGRFRGAAGVTVALLAVAALTGFLGYRQVRDEHAAAQQAMRTFWVEQPAKHPHSAAHYGLWVFKPKQPLSFVDRGVDPYVGVASWLEAHRQNEFTRRPAMDQTPVARMGEWTAAAVLQVLVPLLIVMLAFPAVALERETGTLRQLAAMGVPARSLAVGKALGVAGALGVVLVPAAVIASALLVLGGGVAGDVLARTAGLSLTYLAYFAILIGVALLVSARAPSLRAALLVLLAFWSVNALIAPRAVTDLARRVYPTPSSAQFAAQIQEDIAKGLDGHNPADARRAELEKRVLAEYQVASIRDLPVNFDAIAMQASEDYGNAVFDRRFGELHDIYRAQNRVHQWGALVAPMLAVRQLSMTFAGTDIEQHRDFAVKAEQYRRRLIRTLNDHQRDHSKTGDWEWKADPAVWREIPPFEYVAPQVASVLPTQRGSAIALAAWLVVCGVAIARTRRLPVG